jgi:predicted lactoylglutathione lyase
MGKSLLSNLTDPLVVIGLLVKGFQTFLKLGFAVDKQVTDLSKSMAVSHEEATATRDRFKQIAEEVATSANQSERLVINQYSLSEAQLELAKAFGVTRGFTDQQVKDQVILTKLMGLTGEESKGIQQLAIANGMKVREVTGSIIKQTSALVKQTGIQLDNKEILQDVAKVSGQLRLQYANNPDLIAKAVIQTKLLGISLETAANAAKGLLQFEDSIENELSAELLTGKALNLERARGLALNGKSIEAAAEMLSQVGSSADFINMNVIQQEAIAKAIGMSADELANSLVTQENLANLSANTREQVEQALKKAVTEEEKQRILAKLGNEEDAKAALEKLNAQETLNNAIDQMKKLLGAIFEGPAKGFVNLIAELAGDMPRLMGYFYKLKSILVSLAEFSLAKMAFNVASSV